MNLKRIHHVAYRCNDAKETVDFYRNVLGMEFQLAFAEDTVPSTKAPDPYMHVFLDAGMGNVLAFFELPNAPPMGSDPNTPAWVQHIAFEASDTEALGEAKGTRRGRRPRRHRSRRPRSLRLHLLFRPERSSAGNRRQQGKRRGPGTRARRGRRHAGRVDPNQARPETGPLAACADRRRSAGRHVTLSRPG